MDFPQKICNAIASYIKDDEDICSLRLVSKTWKTAASQQVQSLQNFKKWKPSEVNDADLLRLVEVFPKVHILVPIGTELSAAGVMAACTSLNWLHTLDLRRCPQVTQEVLVLLKGLPCIRALGLRRCISSGDNLAALGELTQLRRLDLSCNPPLTDEVLRAVALLTNLTALDLSLAFNSQDEAILPAKSAHRSYSNQALHATVAALSGLTELTLATPWDWRILGVLSLLRMAVMPSLGRASRASLGSQANAITALQIILEGRTLEEFTAKMEHSLVGIPQLCALLEPQDEATLDASPEHFCCAPTPRVKSLGRLLRPRVAGLLWLLCKKGFGGHVGIWPLFRARPEALAGLVGLLKEGKDKDNEAAVKILGKLTWLVRGRDPGRRMLLDAGVVSGLLGFPQDPNFTGRSSCAAAALAVISLASASPELLSAKEMAETSNPHGCAFWAVDGLKQMLQGTVPEDELADLPASVEECLLDGWTGVISLIERTPATSRTRQDWQDARVGLAEALAQLAIKASSPQLKECAVRGMAVLYPTGDPHLASAAESMIPLLLNTLSPTSLASEPSTGYALLLLARIVEDGCQESLRTILDHGGIPALLSILETGAQPTDPEFVTVAADTLAGLAKCEHFCLRKGAPEALVKILRLPRIKPLSYLPALSKLSAMMKSDANSDPELLRLEAPRAVIAKVKKLAAVPAVAEHAQRARVALCCFAGRSFENTKAVYRQCGLPLLVATQAEDPTETGRRAASNALRFMEAKGGPVVAENIQKARAEYQEAQSASGGMRSSVENEGQDSVPPGKENRRRRDSAQVAPSQVVQKS